MNPTPQGSLPARLVVPATTRREMLVAVGAGLAVLGFVGYGIAVMGGWQRKASTNTLTGKVVAKKFTPAPEDQISFSRKQGLKSEHIAGEHVLEVEVSEENRKFEVPVDGNTYEAIRVGSSFTFIRPPSEQVK
ncbi:MAG TPA: hypothetical protein VFG14_19155 [Chthoniobacteraceae bacterium]|nr:hypothetical protein [Chthoniobacteraceae bacterium]